MSTEKKKKEGTSRHLLYDEKVKSLKENFLWQVHNLKLKEMFGASVVVLCRGRVFFSSFFSLKQRWEVQLATQLTDFRAVEQLEVLQCSSRSPARVSSWSNFRWKSSLIVIIPFLVIVQVGGRMRRRVCDGTSVPSPQSLWRCIPVDFYAVLL